MYHLACERMFPAKHLFTGTLHFPLKKLSMLCGCICIYKKRTDPYYVESIVKLFVSHSCYVLQEICLIDPNSEKKFYIIDLRPKVFNTHSKIQNKKNLQITTHFLLTGFPYKEVI